MKRIIPLLSAILFAGGGAHAQSGFDLNAWKTQYGTALTPSQFYSSRPGPWGDYFDSTGANAVDCANATFLYLGPLGVKARPYDQALSTAAFAALYPNTLVDSTGLMQNAFGVMDVPAGAPADGKLYPGDVIIEMEDQRIKTATDISFPFPIQAQGSRGLEIHAGQLVDAAEGRGAVKMKVIRAARAAWAGSLMTAPTTSGEITVDVTGKNFVQIITTSANNALTNWINPRLENGIGGVLYLNAQTINQKSGYASPIMGKDATNATVLDGATTITNCIGTRANSMIEYAVPSGYTTLKFKVQTTGAGSITPSVRTRLSTVAVTQPNPRQYDGNGAPVLAPELAPYLETIEFSIPRIGSFGSSYNPNGEKVANYAAILAHRLAQEQNADGSWPSGGGDYADGTFRTSLAGLGLLATGDPAYNTHLQKAANYCAVTTPSGWAYPRGTRLMFLAEYYLRTRDAAILPGLQQAVNDAQDMITADFTCGHGLNMGYGGAGYIGSTGTIGTGLAIASKTPVVVDTWKLDNLLERVQELAGGNGGGLPYSRGGIGRTTFPTEPSAGQSYSCGAGGVLATKIRGGPQYITELFRKKFGAATTYGDADGGHASEALTFIMGSLACQIWGDDAHKSNMDRFLWRLTLKRDYSGYINLNTNRLEFHGGDGGCHGGPTYDTGGYLVLLNSHKHNLAITGQPDYQATVFPATPPTYDVDRKLYWRILNNWNMVDAALGSKMPASLQPKLAELRAMPLGSDLGTRTLDFCRREALAAATLVNGIAGLTSPEKQYYCEMLLGIGHDVTVASIDDPVPATGVMSNYRFSLNGYIPSTTWSSWGGPSSAVEPAPGTQMTGSVTLTDPSGVYLATPRVLNFAPGTLNPTTDFQVPVGTQVTMQAAFNYTVGGSLPISYTREIIINPAVPFNVDSRAGNYTNVRKVWIPGNCPIPFEKWNMPVQLPSGITLPGASKNEGTIGFHTYDNGVLVTADDTYKAKIRGKPAGYWAISSDKWGECAILGVNLLSGPVLTTTAVSGITPETANSGGNITSDNGWPITRRGVCWSTSPYPTIFDNKTENGTATGSFTSTITNLQPGTIYHVRAYATNAVGTSYGANVIFTTAGSSGSWAIAGGGSWPVTTNWTGGVDASGADGIADFGAVTPAGDATVTLDGSRSIGGMIFGNAGYTGTWTLQPGTGGSLALEVGSSGTPTVTVNGGSASLATVVSGVDGLIKAGPGTLVLAAANTYTGATSVNAGTLRVTGAISAGSPVTIASGASLTGTGSLGSHATIAGTIAPGVAGIGTLAIAGKLTLAGTTQIEINKTTGTCDKITGMTSLAYGGTLTVTNLSGTLAAGDRFVLFTAGSYSGAFATLNLPVLSGGLKWDTSSLAVDGSIQIGYDAAITGQPVDQSVDQGMSATFDITATGVPAPAFQWQLSTDGGGTWNNINGATGTSHTTAAAAAGDNNRQYRCLVSNTFVALTSNVATLTVTANVLPAFTLHPASTAVTAAGQTATFTAAASGTPAPTLQWQASTNAGASWADIAGATGTSHAFTTVAGDNNKAFRCVATNSVGSVASNPATLAITANPVWINPAGGSWPVAGNWAGGTLANGSNVTADFSRLILPAPATVTLDGARTIGNLVFGDAGATQGWNLTTGSAGPLTLAVTSGTPAITVNNGATTLGLQLASAQGLVKNGAGTLVLSAANNITGGTTLTAGTLALNNGSALGGGTLVISGGTLANTSGSTVTVPGATTWNGDFAFSGPNPLTLSGAATLGANRALGVSAGTLTVSGGIGGAFSLTKNGAGQLTLAAASTYSGGTVVNAGTLLSTSGGWYGDRGIGTGALTVNSGATARFTNSHGFGVEPGGRAATINGGTLQFDRENYISSLAFTGGSLLGGEARFNSSKTINFNAAAAGAVISSGMNLVGGTLTLNVTDSAAVPVDLLVSGYINNGGSLVKSGTGFMKMSGSSTYSGTTSISAGTLQLAGGSLGSGAVTVASAATLAGAGSIAGATTVNGRLTSGVDGAIGTLAFGGNLTLASTSITTMKIAKSGGTVSNDVISASGTLTCGGTLTVTASGDTLADGDMFQILPATTISGTFATVNLPALTGGLTWNTSRLYVDGTLTVGNIPVLPTQTITFGALPTLVVGDVLVLQASASSGLPVIYSSSNPAVALIQYGDYLTTVGVGTTTITASQPGNANYQAATDVSRTLTVNATLPAVSTIPVTLDAGGSVNSGGRNIWDGGASITERGVCWSTVANPTIADSRTLDGTGTTDFTSTLTGLVGGSTYHVRAYVKSSVGYSYGGDTTYVVPVAGVWTLNANGNWTTTTNWSGGFVPNSIGSSASFATLNIGGDRTVTLDTAVTTGAMIFGDTTPTNNWILTAGAGGSLTMATYIDTPVITVNNQTASVNLPIAGNGGLVKAGSGTLTLGAASTFTGGLTVNGGRVNLQSGDYSSTLATGKVVTINNTGTVSLMNTNVANNSIAWVVNQGGTLNFNAYHAHCYGLTLNGGSVTGTGSGKYGSEDFYLQANVTVGGTSPSTISIANGIGLPNRTFTVADATTSPAPDLTISGAGAFRGTGLLTKSGEGTMTLANANVHSGGTTVAAGTLLVTNTTGSATGTGAVIVSATGTLGGTGIISGATTVSGSLEPGSNGIGTLTINNTLALSGVTRMELGKTGATLANDRVQGVSTLTLGGNLEVTASGDSLAGGDTFTLFSATTISGAFATITLPPLPNGLQWNTSQLATTGILSVTTIGVPQTITFGALGTVTYSTTPITLSATASSGLPVSYTSSNPLVATVSGNTLTLVGIGSTVVTATQAGNASFLAAPDVPQTLTVLKATQTISFGALPAKTYGDGVFALTGTTNTGLPITYTSSDPAVVSVSGSMASVVGVGSATITASQAGNANAFPATDVSQVQIVNKGTQVITFAAIPAKTYGDPAFALSVSVNSGLPLTLTSSDPSVATVSGNTVTILTAGTTTITASQAGDDNWNAAVSVPQTLVVSPLATVITLVSPTTSTVSIPANTGLILETTLNNNGAQTPPTLAWSKVSGPGTVTFSPPDTTNTAASFGTTGTYVIRLTANDGVTDYTKDVTVNYGVVPSTWAPAGINVGTVNSSAYNYTAGTGTYTITGASAGIDNNAATDNCQIYGQTFTGDFDLISKVSGPNVSSTSNERLGLIARASSANNAVSAFVGYDTTPTVYAYWIRRTSAGGANTSTTVNNNWTSATSWVRMTRSGSTVTGYISTNGTSWTQAGTMTLAGTVTAGLCWSTDRSGTSATATFTNVSLAGSGTNVGPLVNAGTDQGIMLPAVANLTGTASDDSLPVPVSFTTTWVKASGPATVNFANAGALATTASFTQRGTHVLRLIGNDGQVKTFDDTTITVDALNDPPSFTLDPIILTVDEDVTLNGQLAATDPNIGDTLTFTKLDGPAWLTVSNTGALSGTPANADVGVNTFTVRVADQLGAFDDATLQVTVANTNDAPVFAADPIDMDASADNPFGDQLAATDDDVGASLTFGKVSGPAWLTVDSAGALSGTPAVTDSGVNTFIVSVTDGTATVNATLHITVSTTPYFTVNPQAAAHVPGQSASFTAAAAGYPAPTYQWQSSTDGLGWSNVPGASAATLVYGPLQLADHGLHFRCLATNANGITASTAAVLTVAPVKWTNPAGGSWPVAGNWFAAAVADGSQTIGDFSTLDLTADATVTLDGARTIGGLRFADTTASNNWLLGTGSGGPLTLATASGVPAIEVVNQTSTITAILAGSQGLTKSGAGTLVLSGDNTLAGDISVTAGGLTLNSPNYNTYRGGQLNIHNGSTLTFSASGGSNRYDIGGKTVNFMPAGGGTLAIATGLNFVFTNGNTVNSNGGAKNTISGGAGMNLNNGNALTFNVSRGTDPATDLLVSTHLWNTSGVVTKTGNGILTLSPATTSTYTGGTAINGGRVIATANSAFGSGAITLGATADDAAVYLGNRADITNAVTVSAAGSGLVVIGGENTGSGANAATFSGTLTLNRPTTISGEIAADRLAVEGRITGNVGTLTVSGGGRTTFSNTTNNFVGDLVLTGDGTILQTSVATAAEVIPNASSVTVQSGAVLQLASSSGVESINGLNGGGTVRNFQGGAYGFGIVVGSGGANGDFSGVLANGNNALAFTKTGAGTQTLSGANTYTGATTINQGTLLLTGSLANSTTTVAASGTLAGTGTTAGAVTVNGTLAPGNNGPGNLTVNNTLTFAGGSSVNWQIGDWNGAAGTGYDKITTTSLNLTASPASRMVVRLSPQALVNFSESSRTFTLVQTSSGITGFSADKFTVDTSSFAGPMGSWSVQQSGNNLVLVYTRANTAPVFTANPVNLAATEGSPISGQLTAVDPDAGESLVFAKVGGPSWLTVAANGALSGTPAKADAGFTNVFSVTVTDSLGASATATLNIAVTALDGNNNGILDTWESAHFGSAGAGENPAGGDNDGDGISNLMEYAMGTDPVTANIKPMVFDTETIGVDKFIRLEMPKNPAATNLTYTVETCGDLSGWRADTTAIEVDSANVLRVRDTVPEAGALRRFIRVRITTIP